MIVIQLKPYLSACPVWWQNIIEHMQTEYPMQKDGGYSTRNINKELKKLDGVKFIDECDEYPNCAVVFKDDTAYIMFLMHWR